MVVGDIGTVTSRIKDQATILPTRLNYHGHENCLLKINC